jgi:hypothetical protein
MSRGRFVGGRIVKAPKKRYPCTFELQKFHPVIKYRLVFNLVGFF